MAKDKSTRRKLVEGIGKAAFDRSKRGKEVNATRPQKQQEPRTRMERFDSIVNREMRGGAPRAEAIATAQRRLSEKL